MKLIAECATTHGGDLDCALKLVNVAKYCGATHVKFQHVDPRHFKPNAMWRGWNLREWYTRCRFSMDQWKRIMRECDSAGIEFLCTPQTLYDFADLVALGIKEVKVSSDNLTNLPLLRRIVEEEMPCYASIGMATKVELDSALEILSPLAAALTLMACTSLYPCPPEHVNLNRIYTLWGAKHYVGFSDHTIGHTAVVMAYAMGVRTFEKHLHFDDSGPDYSDLEDQDDFRWWVKALHNAELICGNQEIAPAPGARAAMELTE